ncbi:MAG: hypothetical protein KDH92_03065, partial [Chloroflexi bacterium]|nr:hypothetical protein [Chloroflexota bacterium]
AAQQEQFATVQEAGGAFGSYLEAARGAREEAGLFGRIGFMASDAWASFKDVLTNFLGVLSPLVDTLKGAGQAVGGVLSSLGEKVGLDLSFPEPSEVGAIRDATMAYLEMNKGFDESVLKSGEFKTAQAQAALALENGEIGAVEYKNALESAAGAIARRTAEAQLDAEAAATQSSAYADLTDGATAYSSVMVDANGQIITAAQQRAAAEADAAQAAIDAQAADLQRLVNRGEMEQVTADSIIASRQRAVDNMVEGLAVTQSGYDAERTAMLAMADGGAEALGFLGSSHQTTTNIITTGQREMQGEFANTGSAASTSFGSIDETVTDTAAGMVAGAADIEGATTTVRDAFGNIVPGAQQLSAGVGGALDAVIPKVAGFADETERAAQAQARAQGEAVGAAEDFGAGTVDSFAGVSDQAVDTTGMVGELQVALEELPPEVTTAYVLTGVPQARELLGQINADLQSIAAVIKFSLVGTYTGTGGAEKNSPMAVLTDIWSLRDESSMPFGFAATYSASGAMAWEAGQLAITGGVAALRRQAEDPIEFTVEARISEALQLLLFDADYEAAALQAAQDELARLGEEADKAAAKLALAQQALDGFTPRVVKEINEFFGGAFQSALGGASGALGAAIDAALASASLSDQDPA